MASSPQVTGALRVVEFMTAAPAARGAYYPQ
ncbi:protein of unknown function [Micropruina glycogenica]|uniref:Uncharacterized protein n=1 Tax=Micropruina glycogenica TaxID=75385 RepID=A0A2N9JIP9_9ACTN|nr:protein of unknown function [Micropruina glycogenica]